MSEVYKNQHCIQAGRFLISGLLATVMHLLVYWVCITSFTLPVTPASGVGFSVAFIVSFSMQKFWTFQNSSMAKTERQLLYFFVMQITLLLMNMVGVYILVEMRGVAPMLGQFFILVFTAFVSFMISKFVIFKHVSQ